MVRSKNEIERQFLKGLSVPIYIYPSFIDHKGRIYGLGFICCDKKESAMRSLLGQNHFEYIDFEDPCVFVFITKKFEMGVIRKNFPLPFIVKDSRIIYFLKDEISLKGEYDIVSEVEIDTIPRFVDTGFSLNPLRQLIVSENRMEQEEKMCLLLLCDTKLLEILQSKGCIEEEITLKRQIKGKMKVFHNNSMEQFHKGSRGALLKLLFFYRKTLKKILGILPPNPRGSVSAFLYLVEDLEKENDFERTIAYFQPICAVKKIKVEFVIDKKPNRHDTKTRKLEKYLNRKRNHLEIYTIRPKGKYESLQNKQFQRFRYEIIADFHWDSPDLFDIGEFFSHLVKYFEEGLEKIDEFSFRKFKQKEPRELWIKEIILIMETPNIFAETIIGDLRKYHSQGLKFTKQELLDRTVIELTLSYLEPEDYIGTQDGAFNLVQQKPFDIFSRIAVDWALDRDFKQSHEFMQRALYALVADFLSLIYRDEGISKSTIDKISAYVLPSVERNLGKWSVSKTKKKRTERLKYFRMMIKDISKVQKRDFSKKTMYFPNQEQLSEIQNTIRGLFLSIPRKRVPKREIVEMAKKLYEETKVSTENEPLEYAHYSKLESQLEVVKALIESLKWLRKIGLFEEGISIRNKATKLRKEKNTEFLEEMRRGNELIKQSTLRLVKDTSTFEDDLAILYTSMMRDLQREFPDETQNWIWGA